MSLDEIISKLRKVKYGDYILADDHNDLVDAVKLMRENILVGSKEFFFKSTETYSIYNDARRQWFNVYKSIYSKKIGDIKTDFIWERLITSLMHVTVKGQDVSLYIALHTSDHPAGETIEGIDLCDLPDFIDSDGIGSFDATPIRQKAGDITPVYTPDYPYPLPLYVVIWIGSTAVYKDAPFTGYVSDIHIYSRFAGIWS